MTRAPARAPLVALLAALALGACDARTVAVRIDPSKATYARDLRTGLCFAAFGRANSRNPIDLAEGLSITTVPCSHDVLRLVPLNQGGER